MKLEEVLWIGGAQWAGKSTVANLLAARYPLVRYAFDYHDARSHSERAKASPNRFPAFNTFLAALDIDPDSVWADPAPEAMAEHALRIFAERFELVLEDIVALPEGTRLLAEGWGLRPNLIVPYLPSSEHAVFLVPTDEFREQQLATVARAGSLGITELRNPERAQRNRVERDRILAADVVEQATRLGLPVIHVDGSEHEGQVATRVETQFRPHLPTWLY